MQLRHISLIAFVLFFTQHLLSAQMQRTLYQAFEIDSFQVVELDIADQYEILVWAGSSILIETNIKLSNCSPEILDFLIAQGRYDVKMDTLSETNLKIATKDRDRKKLKRPGPRENCTEEPLAKIFVPDVFTWTSDKLILTRKEPIVEEGN